MGKATSSMAVVPDRLCPSSFSARWTRPATATTIDRALTSCPARRSPVPVTLCTRRIAVGYSGPKAMNRGFPAAWAPVSRAAGYP